MISMPYSMDSKKRNKIVQLTLKKYNASLNGSPQESMEWDINAFNFIVNGTPQKSMEWDISAFNAVMIQFPLSY